MDKNKENKNSLGFLFSFKESEQVDNTISIVFKSGFSKKIPNKYKYKKDFSSMEIFEGDTSDLFINVKEYVQLYNKELKEDVLDSKDHYQELYQQRKYVYHPPINEDQYLALTAFNYARLYYMYSDFQNDKEKREALQLTVGKLFNNKADLLEIHNSFTNANHQMYLNEINDAFNDGPTVKKLKL